MSSKVESLSSSISNIPQHISIKNLSTLASTSKLHRHSHQHSHSRRHRTLSLLNPTSINPSTTSPYHNHYH
ncbi:hypothetical protein MFRU_006g00450 [Monilinia fructicola]|uniref:Uncharacterized protein n=1 Tax=Monilinia fructicola TaxID=38448 RepID=A0A5M9JC56_MONFR|nr:hypothetical protein EYC84_009322 [Monilinia fructicola]KAG4032574.1 hypothetical protein MFRU_006g00450 [Monilinia fructicola]